MAERKRSIENLMKNLFISVLSLLGLCTSCRAEDFGTVLPVEEYAIALKQDTAAVLVDVRRSDEFSAGHLAGALNINVLDETAFAQGIAGFDTNHTYYIYCRSGRRSQRAAQLMTARGLHVVDMRGGFLAWEQAGMPIVKD